MDSMAFMLLVGGHWQPTWAKVLSSHLCPVRARNIKKAEYWPLYQESAGEAYVFLPISQAHTTVSYGKVPCWKKATWLWSGTSLKKIKRAEMMTSVIVPWASLPGSPSPCPVDQLLTWTVTVWLLDMSGPWGQVQVLIRQPGLWSWSTQMIFRLKENLWLRLLALVQRYLLDERVWTR